MYVFGYMGTHFVCLNLNLQSHQDVQLIQKVHLKNM